MDTINFKNDKKNFPLSTEALEFMKLISQKSYQLASLGGVGNYILSGCVNTSGNNWSAGWVVINGELLPFTASSGTLTSNVRIIETPESVVVGIETYANVFIRRAVAFGNNVGGANTFVWDTFTRVKSNLELAAQSATKTELATLSNLMLPKGGIIMWSGAPASIPVGFALCDGNFVLGVSTPINELPIPDLRGRFVVGLDPRINQSQVTDVTDMTLNYGVVKSTGGKASVKLSATDIPELSIAGQVALDDSNFSNELAFAAADDNSPQNAFSIKIGNANPNSIENRPPYMVLAYIIKVV